MEECKRVSTPMNQKEMMKEDDGAELVVKEYIEA